MLETGEFDVPAGWAGVRRQQEIARQNAQRLECAAEACRGVGLVGEEIAPGGDRVEAGAEHDDDTSILLAGMQCPAHRAGSMARRRGGRGGEVSQTHTLAVVNFTYIVIR